MTAMQSEDDMDLDAELELVQSDAALAWFVALPCERFGGLSDKSPQLLLRVLRRYYETQTRPLDDPWPGRLYAHLVSRSPCPSHVGPALLAWLRATPDWSQRRRAMRWTANAARRASYRINVAILSATANYYFAVILHPRASEQQVNVACGYFNIALSNANRDFLKSLGETHSKHVTAVAKMMMSCGDSSTQMTLLENILYFSDDPQTAGRARQASLWFPEPENSIFRKNFWEMSFGNFHRLNKSPSIKRKYKKQSSTGSIPSFSATPMVFPTPINPPAVQEYNCSTSESDKSIELEPENDSNKNSNIADEPNKNKENIEPKNLQWNTPINVKEITETTPKLLSSASKRKLYTLENSKIDFFSEPEVSECDPTYSPTSYYSHKKADKKKKESKITNTSRIVQKTGRSTRKSSVVNKSSSTKSPPKKRGRNARKKMEPNIQNLNSLHDTIDSIEKIDLCNEEQSVNKEHNTIIESIDIVDDQSKSKKGNLKERTELNRNVYATDELREKIITCCNEYYSEQRFIMSQYISDISAIHKNMLSDIEKHNGKLIKDVNTMFDNSVNLHTPSVPCKDPILQFVLQPLAFQ